MSNVSNKKSSDSSKRETVLVMQGGGSLGAYECGACKALAKHNIKFDIIAGTSIGAINATIIAAGYSKEDGIKQAVKILEDFWIDLAEGNTLAPPFLPYKVRSQLSATYSFLYGNKRAFTPLWIVPGGMPYYYFFSSPYLYNTATLRKTISSHVDFRRFGHSLGGQEIPVMQENNRDANPVSSNSRININSSNNDVPRLILTATNVQTGEPVIFDSNNAHLTIDHVMASAGYAVYGLPWTTIKDSYLWDGAFVHNTPLKAVTKKSNTPKHVYVSDVFPRKQEQLPGNMPETYHRIRDLLFTDRTIEESKEMSKRAKKDLALIEQMHELIVSEISSKNKDTKLKSKLSKIEEEYTNLVTNKQGLIIDNIVHIQRKERPGRHFIFEDADFSIETIRELILQGEEDAEEAMTQTNK